MIFDSALLVIIIGFTLVSFSWLLKYHSNSIKFYFLFFVIVYCIYSGIGGALINVSNDYIFYYVVFTICLSLGIYIGLNTIKSSKHGKRWVDWDLFLTRFCNAYSSRIIILYYSLILVDLIVPENKLMNIIHPPQPDVLSMLDARYSGNESNIITSIINNIRIISYPFFLLSLYKYREKSFRLCIIILGTYYLTYCKDGYIGRGSMLEALIIIVIFTYAFRPKLKKIILIASVCIIPSITIFLVNYSVTRIGGSAENISAIEAISVLISQECSYPQYFKAILQNTNDYALNYLLWLFTMPLPGFFRGGIDANFNALFSEFMLGIPRTSNGFFILLPGVVGESVFLFGKYLFWINGLLYGLIMGWTYRILSKHSQLFGLLIASAICFGYTINRGGMASGIPFILKVLCYFYLLLVIVKNKKCWYV